MRRSLWFIALLFMAAPNAHAGDVTRDFHLSGTFADDSTVSGTLAIDVTDGKITAANLFYDGQTYNVIQSQGPFFGLTSSGQTPIPVDYGFYLGSSSSTLPQLGLSMPGTSAVDSLIGYEGGSLCSLNAECGPDQEGNFWLSAFETVNESYVLLESGQLVATPEPSTVILFGTALLGLVPFRRKLFGR